MTMAKKVLTMAAMDGRRNEGGGGVTTSLRKHAVLRLTLALLAVALTALVISDLRRPAPGGAASGLHRRLGNRSARKKRPRPAALAGFADPRTVVAKEGDAVVGTPAELPPGDFGDGPGPATVTVYLLGGKRLLGQEYSFFQTDDLARYGTGRIRYALKKKARNTCQKGQTVLGAAPCLVVGPSNYYPADRRDCLYSQCRVMATNDERCGVNPGDPSLYGIRQYFSVTRLKQLYLPLGSRIDAWTSFQKHKAAAEAESGAPFAVLPASQRKYAFNAIFSKTTNYRRKELSEIIENYNTPMPFYASIAKKWRPDANDPRNDYLDTDHYIAALLDSVFTLCPAGGNPEAFRLFEAVEAGSIPVMVRDEMLNMAPQLSANGKRPLDEGQIVHCEGSLSHWLEAPVVVLESWDELFPTIEGLMRDVSALDERQTRLRQWYTEYMMELVRVFEDYMLAAPSGDEKGGQE